MSYAVLIMSTLISATSVTITEPVDGETYDGDWLMLKAIVENDDEVPDSLHSVLNGSPTAPVPRLSTDWYTYMQNDLHHGYSESPAPPMAPSCGRPLLRGISTSFRLRWWWMG